MKCSSQALAFCSYYWGLLTIIFTVSLPAQASIVCEPGTTTKHSNNSLAGCILGQDMTIKLSTSNAGTHNFDCQSQSYIYFDENGQFESCQLAQDMYLKQGNSITKCPADYRVYVSSLGNGILSVNCRPLR